MSEVCIRGPIKIHIHPILTARPLRRRHLHYNYDNYVTIQDIVRTKKRCLNVCKVRENKPPFGGNADDARAQSENWWN